MDIKRITAQRIDGRPLVHVDILDPQFLGQGQILVGPGVVEAPAPRTIAPFGGIELEPLDGILFDHLTEGLQARLLRPWIE
jgi:hypothetical protein